MNAENKKKTFELIRKLETEVKGVELRQFTEAEISEAPYNYIFKYILLTPGTVNSKVTAIKKTYEYMSGLNIEELEYSEISDYIGLLIQFYQSDT